MEIIEVKRTLTGVRKEFPCELCRYQDDHAVLMFRVQRDSHTFGLDIPAGTMSFGYFWTDRPYNVYHWLRPNGTTAAVYFNISDQTRIDRERVEWRDLAVDLLITPEGRFEVMDEDEVPDDVDPLTRATIDRTKQHLIESWAPISAEVEVTSRALAAGLTPPPAGVPR